MTEQPAADTAELYDEWTRPPAELTQMPQAGLDDLTPERAAQEIRGAVYQARRLLARAVEAGNERGIREARRTLAMRLCIARAERITPFWRPRRVSLAEVEAHLGTGDAIEVLWPDACPTCGRNPVIERSPYRPACH
jgi:hypothetical protein